VVVGGSARVRHSRMLLAGIQANFGLAPRLKHSGVTTWGKVIRGPLDTPQFAAGLFIYIAEEQLRSTMWQLARDVRELDRTVRAPAPIEEPRRSEILKLLVSMEHATERLGQEGRRSNHPVIDEHLATLRRDIALARKQVENEPPNYVLVGLLPGACMYCHSGGR
jgi:hypothetical protein